MNTSALPATMRAISQDTFGGPEVLKEVRLPVPAPGPGRILVRVRASGLNPTDWKHRAAPAFLGEPPFVLGWDVSGTVVATGLGVTLFRPGDEVFGMLPHPYGVGAHAEYAVGPTRAFARKPAALDHVHAAALPLAGLTAWQALVDVAGVGPGDRVLVHAAAGGVGHLAVQIAKARGAHVTGTASGAHHALLRDLGADELIDYRRTDFAAGLAGLDVVLDPIGGDYRTRSLPLLRPGGTLVSLQPHGTEELAAAARAAGVRGEVMIVEADHAGMNALADLASTGHLRPVIAATHPLSEAATAHAAGERGGRAGKLVLVMD
ncbi:NADP-dependent oxidoreductase [Streptomyces mobaraensis]|uniref:NADP-dependent oxidoreductase n=1 Tax=Streptomyces mobaraensis TaxID=35621 RepID=UPI00332F1A4F